MRRRRLVLKGGIRQCRWVGTGVGLASQVPRVLLLFGPPACASKSGKVVRPLTMTQRPHQSTREHREIPTVAISHDVDHHGHGHTHTRRWRTRATTPFDIYNEQQLWCVGCHCRRNSTR